MRRPRGLGTGREERQELQCSATPARAASTRAPVVLRRLTLTMIERRAFFRWPVALAGQIYATDGSSACLIHDISEDGLSFASRHSAQLDEELTVAWKLDPHEPPVQVQCLVRDDNPDHTGVQFLNLTRVDRLRVIDYMRRASGEHRGES